MWLEPGSREELAPRVLFTGAAGCQLGKTDEPHRNSVTRPASAGRAPKHVQDRRVPG